MCTSLGLLCSTDTAVTTVSRDMLEPILNELAQVTLFNWGSSSSRDNKMAQTTKHLHRFLGRICGSCKAHAKPCVAVNVLPVASSYFSWASVGTAGSPPSGSALTPGQSSTCLSVLSTGAQDCNANCNALDRLSSPGMAGELGFFIPYQNEQTAAISGLDSASVFKQSHRILKGRMWRGKRLVLMK